MARREPPREGPDWRHRRLHALPAPSVDAKTAIFPEEVWGTPWLEIDGLPSHLSVWFKRVPEGMVLLARCDGCGARQEGLLDGRVMYRDLPVRDLARHIQDDITRILPPVIEEWVPRHAACAETPIPQTLPAHVQAFADACLRDATWDITAGRSAPGAILALLSDDTVVGVKIDDVPESDPSTPAGMPSVRTRVLASRHYALREFIRQRELDVVAAVLLSEVWLSMRQSPGALHPHLDPERREGLTLTCVTEHMGRMGLALIHREGHRIGKGPGTLEPMQWQPLRGDSRMMDGLLAQPIIMPQPDLPTPAP